MWELSITIGKENKKILTPLYDKLSGALKSVKGVVVYDEDESRAGVSVACEDDYSGAFSRVVDEEITNLFLEDFKRDYLIKNARLTLSNPINYNAFIKALVAFDREFDRELIQKHLSYDKEVSLDGFYNFRLKELKSRWQEVCSLANDNAHYLNFHDTFVELMRFLVNTIDSRADEALIENDGEKYKVTNLESKESSIVELNDLLPSLICLAPNKIYVGKNTEIPENVYCLIKQIFTRKNETSMV